MKPYWSNEELGLRLFHGDCLEVFPELGEEFDLVFGDPPYGVGKADWDEEALLQWLEVSSAYSRRFVVVTPGICNLRKLPEEFGEHEYVWETSGWLSNNCTRGPLGFGNWIASVAYCRKGVSPYRQAQDAKRIVIRGKMPDHPSPKPIDYMLWQTELWTDEGESIIDPFCGSGTSLVAAYRLGRKCTGVEISEEYCEGIVARMEEELKQKRLFAPKKEDKPTTIAMEL